MHREAEWPLPRAGRVGRTLATLGAECPEPCWGARVKLNVSSLGLRIQPGGVVGQWRPLASGGWPRHVRPYKECPG